jgi:hypothetical protein
MEKSPLHPSIDAKFFESFLCLRTSQEERGKSTLTIKRLMKLVNFQEEWGEKNHWFA